MRIPRPAVVAALALSCSLAQGAEAEKSSVDRLSWLAGCWERRAGDRIMQEQWTRPLGGTMLGVTRTVAGGKTVAWETLRIEETGDGLVLVALPSDQSEARFAQLGLDESSVAFSNPEHDFPREIRYRLEPDGSLVGQIVGDRGGERRVIDFPYERVSCDDPPEEPDPPDRAEE